MKIMRWIIFCLILGILVLLFFHEEGDFTLSQSFKNMIASSDKSTMLTSIIIFADLEDKNIEYLLIDRLPESKGIERSAILYSLYMHNGNLEQEFIDSIQVDEQSIRDLLVLESPSGSYFRAPYLRVIKAIGDISIHNDKALEKLKRIYQYSDGWQGDSILEMIIAAERIRGNDTNLLLDSLFE